ncbi:MAG: type II toxin-antitoxin system PemK/MazF family toxin [Armatimonadetes bacterium]|nr:type II toxin-antitoxin system PemK/MazF family toxin [Armatimonadota bacterium]
MFSPGDVVLVNFPGAVETKRRPGIVVSATLYQTHRPDVIVGLLTTQISRATTSTDYVLQDWTQAGLHQPTAFRSYLITFASDDTRHIGHLSERDWQGVQACLARALALPALF